MNLSFIGMSGSGKSLLSKRLEQNFGFKNYGCDDYIAKELAAELPPDSDVHNVANWLTEPGSPDHSVRETRYLALENRTLKQICDSVEKNLKLPSEEVNKVSNTVIDTTGSVIYLPPTALDRLKDLTTVIYLRVDKADLSLMIERYFSDPKPVIWGTYFSRQATEDTNSAIRRCYPHLLSERAKSYEKLAHHIFDVRVGELPKLSLEELLASFGSK